MKNIFVLISCCLSFGLFAQQTPWGMFVAPNQAKFKIFDGVASVGGVPLAVGDYVGAFNKNEEIIGFAQIENVVSGQALFSLEIFESATGENGIAVDESYELQYYIAAEHEFYTLESFGTWTAAQQNGELADGDNFTIYDAETTPDQSITLPIELLTFSGKSSVAGNALFWSTATEQENAHFILEKSIDGVEFTSFAQVKGAGNSERISHYDYFDEHPYNGLTYYRLQSVDYSGGQEYSEVIAIENATSQAKLVKLFPNPATQSATIRFSNQLNISQLKVVDVTGQLILQKNISLDTDEIVMTVENWTAGIYFVQLRGLTGQWTELLTVK